jgi:hypothetical protein
MSFVFLAIYWNNHHHMIHCVKQVNGRHSVGNMHLLFWLSLTPYVTAWLGEHGLQPAPGRGVWHRAAGRGDRLLRSAGRDSSHGRHGFQTRALAVGADVKGKVVAAAVCHRDRRVVLCCR